MLPGVMLPLRCRSSGSKSSGSSPSKSMGFSMQPTTFPFRAFRAIGVSVLRKYAVSATSGRGGVACREILFGVAGTLLDETEVGCEDLCCDAMGVATLESVKSAGTFEDRDRWELLSFDTNVRLLLRDACESALSPAWGKDSGEGRRTDLEVERREDGGAAIFSQLHACD